MALVNYRWSIAPSKPDLAREWSRQLGIPTLLAQCLLNRGLRGPDLATGFLQPRLKHLADPFLLPNMELAVERLFEARELQEPLVIFGDYDVDGVTSTALLLEVFAQLGWKAHSYLPHRRDEGYGLSREGVENCLKKYPVKLLLAVDCGSTTVETISWLRDRGVDVLVLDHHQVSNPAPPAFALVNPHSIVCDDSGAPPRFAELCSVGLAFKLAHALVKRARERNEAAALGLDLRPLLDLVALGTIADIVPLVGENRILVSAGLERLSSTDRPGLVALKQLAKCPAEMGVREVAYQLAPRLNAAGRLETAMDSLHLVQARTVEEALLLAERLDVQNRERQEIERNILKEVTAHVETHFKPERDFVIVAGNEAWHVGVVGVVASRLLQKHYRPTIVVGGDGASLRGSGRSIPGFDLAAALRACSDLLVRHGGHAMAAGVTVLPENLDALRERLNGLAQSALTSGGLQPPLNLDAEVALPELSLDSVASLERLKPAGQGNPPVQLCVRGVVQQRAHKRMGGDNQHVKMWVSARGASFETVWWGAGASELPAGPFDLAFSPEVNEYNGRRTVQLKLLDWRPDSGI